MRTTPPLLGAAAAVAATAAVGAAGTDVDSRWYARLDKPSWQPPGPVLGVVWTALYVSIAGGGGRALARATDPDERRRYVRAYAANLALNAGWTWIFFRGRQPLLALAETVLLAASTADLTRRTWRLDRPAGAALVPYAAWVGFATALTAEIARRNGGLRR